MAKEAKRRTTVQVSRLDDVQFPQPDTVPENYCIAGFAGQANHLFLSCLRGSFELRETLASVAVLVALVPSVANRHRSIFTLLVD
jgi:hypothetical protein